MPKRLTPGRTADVANDAQQCITDQLLILLALIIIFVFIVLFIRHFYVCLTRRNMYRAPRGSTTPTRFAESRLCQNDLYTNLLISAPSQRSVLIRHSLVMLMM